jgi:hypothetical protein
MHAAIPLSLRTLPLWLAVFFSPAIYCFSFLVATRLNVAPNLPPLFYVAVFFLILAGALFFCLGAVCTAKFPLPQKIALTVFTSLGLLLQFAVASFILRVILLAIIAYV